MREPPRCSIVFFGSSTARNAPRGSPPGARRLLAVSDASELLAVIEFVVSVLHRQNVAYFITGSLASSIHGEFRATKDVDVVAMLERRHLARLTEECSAEFFADLDQAITALETGTSFNLIHRGTYFKVDVFPCVTAFDREATRRAIDVVPPGGHGPLRVATKEDILLAKLRWYRLGDEQSEVQQRDIEGLVALNRDHFDRAYLSRWAEALGVDDLLRRFLSSTSPERNP